MFCKNCGSKIDDGAKFCMKCGTAVNSAFPQTAPVTPTPMATPQAVPVQQIATVTPAPQAGNAAAGKKKGKSKTKPLKIIGIVVLAIIFLVFLIGVFSTEDSPSVLTVDIGTLTKEISNNTARANQLYQGKTMRVSGYVIDISNDYIFLAQYADSWLAGEDGIFVYLNSSETTKLANLKKRQRITVRGVYDGSFISCIRRAVIE